MAQLEDLGAHWGQGKLIDCFAPSVAGRFQRRLSGAFERAAASPGMVTALIEFGQTIDVRDILPSIRVPTLVIHRSEEIMPIEAGREFAELIPGARFVELPGRDHAFWYGDQSTIADEIERFVTGGHAAAPGERALASSSSPTSSARLGGPQSSVTASGASCSSATTRPSKSTSSASAAASSS